MVLLTVFAEGSRLYGGFAFMVTHLHQVHSISLAMAGQIVMLFGMGAFCLHLVPTVWCAGWANQVCANGVAHWSRFPYLTIALSGHWA